MSARLGKQTSGEQAGCLWRRVPVRGPAATPPLPCADTSSPRSSSPDLPPSHRPSPLIPLALPHSPTPFYLLLLFLPSCHSPLISASPSLPSPLPHPVMAPFLPTGLLWSLLLSVLVLAVYPPLASATHFRFSEWIWNVGVRRDVNFTLNVSSPSTCKHSLARHSPHLHRSPPPRHPTSVCTSLPLVCRLASGLSSSSAPTTPRSVARSSSTPVTS